MTWLRHPKVSPAYFPGDLVGQTAAAAIAEMSVGYFMKLHRAGLGLTSISTEDGKDGWDPTEVKLWSVKRKGERKPGRRPPPESAHTRIHIYLSVSLLSQLKSQARKEKVPVSVIIRRKLSG